MAASSSNAQRGYSTNPDRFEFFGKGTPFNHVISTVKHPVAGDGSNVVLVYNNVAVTLFNIPVDRSLEVLKEGLFKSLPHKVLTLEDNNTKVINLDY
jgi:predicted RecA/RadA family phage recombinase